MRTLFLVSVIVLGCGGSGGGGGGGGSTGGGGGGGDTLPPSTAFALDESSAPVGAPVTATGAGFGGAPGSVTFGGVPAMTVLVWTDTRVSVVVPPGAASGSFVLTTASGDTFSAPFTVATGDVFFVAPSGSNANPGTLAAPFLTIQYGVNQSGAGDWVVVRGGTYDETVTTQAAGVTIAGYPGEAAKIDRLGRCLTINHATIAVKDLEIESNFGANDAVRTSNASNMVLRRLAIHDAGSATTGAGDGIDIIGGTNMLVDNCTIYDCLAGSWSVQTDSHGIVAGGGFSNLTIRRCSIYRVSGDCVQADPGRSPWSGLVIEGCDLWTGPLPMSKAAWVAGQIPGENALDTKTPASPVGAQTFTVRDSTIHGFSSGWIGNQAALNVKEAVSGTIERCTIYDNVLAFRMRGATNGTITVKNCVVYDSTYALRYEDGIANLRFHNVTFADSATAHFQNGGGGGLGAGFQALNCLFQGSVPAEASGPSNLGVTTAVFVNAAARDYHLVAGSAPVDAGVTIAGVTDDRDGNARPAGAAYDVGAYER